MLELLNWQLSLLGFSVITANNGRDGVMKAIEEKPHLIIMDILMPGMDGLEATRLIRSNPKTQETPILAATVLFRESDLQSCIEAGCNDIILKPFTYQELKGKLLGYA